MLNSNVIQMTIKSKKDINVKSTQSPGSNETKSGLTITASSNLLTGILKSNKVTISNIGPI